MKTEGMLHQTALLPTLAANQRHYAVGWEQGTGKTWELLADAEAQMIARAASGMLVVAPKGVHTNWVLRELPAHFSIPYRAEAWKSGAGKKKTAALKALLKVDYGCPAILSMNIDALNTKKGRDFARAFLDAHDAVMVIDESSRIKNITAARTKHAIDLGEWAISKRIASGTMITKGPANLFTQFEFLAPRKGLLGTRSYRAFVAEYTELLPPEHPLVQKAARAARMPPQIARTDARGRPIYKNQDRLRQIIAPVFNRVLKKDCLDLPPKVYQTVYFDMTPRQRKIYDAAEKELRFERSDGDIMSFNGLSKLTKLRQITSGFIMEDGAVLDEDVTGVPAQECGPRLAVLGELLEDVDDQFIIWCHYRAEIGFVAALLAANGISFVEYHGGIKDAQRDEAIDTFQAGAVRCFLGTPAAGGIGLTLTNATTAIYYSNDYDLEQRLQSEDRCHRKGTVKSVNYIDIVAENSIDVRMAEALQAKEEVAKQILD